MVSSFAAVPTLLAFLVVGSPAVSSQTTEGVIPENGLNLRIWFIFDRAFCATYKTTAALDKDIEDLVQKTEGILNHESIGRTVTLNVTKRYTKRTLSPTAPTLRSLAKWVHVSKSFTEANMYMFVSGSSYGHSGLLPRGSKVCSQLKGLKVVMARHIEDNDLTAKLIAKLIAFNLGIKRDYGMEGRRIVERLAEDQTTTCTNVGGYMDRAIRQADKWSRCSVEDFIDSYENDKLSCLPENQPEPPTATEPPPPPPPTTESEGISSVEE